MQDLIAKLEALKQSTNNPEDDHSFNRAIKAAVKVVRQHSEWRPIETCPTNVSVLIWLPSCEHYGPGIYRAILCDMGTGKRWHTTAWASGRDLDPRERPEWWMPLPAPPRKD
jgi:hypothetical protein